MNNITLNLLNKNELDGLDIHYAFYETVYGLSIIASVSNGICYVGFGEKEQMIKSMKLCYPKANLTEQENEIHRLALSFIHNEEVSNLPLSFYGTPFQIDVWTALLQVPLGQLTSYQEIAKSINNPKAVRAVGSAVGSNPISYIIPCHRIIRSDGGLGGYFWGLDIKKKMIEREKDLTR